MKARTVPRFIRPRTLMYAGALTVVSLVMLGAFLMRSTLDVTVLRDRAPLFVSLSDGSVRNAYTVKIVNKRRDETPLALVLQAPDGFPRDGAGRRARRAGPADAGAAGGRHLAVSCLRHRAAGPAAAAIHRRHPSGARRHRPRGGEPVDDLPGTEATSAIDGRPQPRPLDPLGLRRLHAARRGGERGDGLLRRLHLSLGVTAAVHERGRGYDAVLAEAARQDALGWRAAVRLEGGALLVAATDRDGAPSPAGSRAWLLRPLEGAEVPLVFTPRGSGRWAAEVAALQRGQWEARLTLFGPDETPFDIRHRLVVP